MKLSNKVEAMQFSPIRKFNPIAQKAKDAGKKVYHLNIGQPDVETPACFMEAIRNYENKVIAYAESGGVTAVSYTHLDVYKRQLRDHQNLRRCDYSLRRRRGNQNFRSQPAGCRIYRESFHQYFRD